MTREERETRASRVRGAHGPLGLEALLRADVIADRERIRADPRLCVAPFSILVPSRSLRLHLARQIVEWTGGACVGVEVQTLAGAARRVLAAAGENPPRGGLFLQSLVTAALRADPLLARELSSFDDAERTLAATLRDLFDAGFEPENADALMEALHDSATAASGTRAETERAAAILRCARVIADRASALRIDVGAGALRRAARILTARPDLLATRGISIFGFADATGAALDFIEPLLRRPGARVYMDLLADGAFGAPLRARLSCTVNPVPVPPSDTVVTLSRATSVDAEARAAVKRTFQAIERGVAPERIAIVARDLTPYRVALRRHLGRLAVPFSVLGASGSLGPADRRVRALAELFSSAGECALGRWMDASDASLGATLGREAIVSAGLRALGAADLRSLAGLDLDARLRGQDTLRLRLRAAAQIGQEIDEEREESDGDAEDEAEDVHGESLPPSRLVPVLVTRGELESELRRAREALARLEHWKPAATALEHAALVRAFLTEALSWNERTPGRDALDDALEEVTRDTPHGLELESAVFFALLAVALEHAAVTPLGREGGGIAILDVTEARGRTFEMVHVLGLVRGRFPRVVREDPLFSDALRGRLAVVLPDLPRKGTGRDEERVLFEALVRSAPVVHLSWPTLDDEGKALLPSALLEHVADPARIANASVDPEPLSVNSDHPDVPRPAHEHHIVGALSDRRAAFDELAELAIEEVRSLSGLDSAGSAPIARARSKILAEFEPSLTDRARLGPYLGFLGRADAKDDPRGAALYVSHLEAVAGCGWQAFLKYILRLEPPFDPSSNLPDVDPRLVGDVVHAVLSRVVDSRTARVAWPEASELHSWLFVESRSALAERGILLSGFEELVVARVRPLIEVARELDRREGPAPRSQSEIGGAIAIPAGFQSERELSFRADRIDERASGKRYTDFKTGKPKSKAVDAERQRKSLVQEISSGRKLQAMVYARHAGAGGVGRYVYLDEALSEQLRDSTISNDDGEANTALDEALEVLLGAFDMGVFTPRLLGSNLARDGDQCARCEFKIACLRGDSTAHRRLAEFVLDQASASSAEDDAARKLWNIGRGTKPAETAPKPARKRGKKDA